MFKMQKEKKKNNGTFLLHPCYLRSYYLRFNIQRKSFHIYGDFLSVLNKQFLEQPE